MLSKVQTNLDNLLNISTKIRKYSDLLELNNYMIIL